MRAYIVFLIWLRMDDDDDDDNNNNYDDDDDNGDKNPSSYILHFNPKYML